MRRPAPQPARAPNPPAITDRPPSWEELTIEPAATGQRPGGRGASARKGSGNSRVPAFDALSARNRVLWVVVASAAGVILLLLGAVLWLAFGSSRPTTQAPAPPRPTFYVAKQTKTGVFPTLRAAVDHARVKASTGARIVVQDDLAEDEVPLINLHDVSIEAPEGRRITWRPRPGGQPQSLLLLSNATDVRLKGITLDGEGRAVSLIKLSLRCPGVVLEELTLNRFTKYGIWITNCDGGDKRVSLLRLNFRMAQPAQAALFFDVSDKVPGIPKDRRFLVRDCDFGDHGTKVKTPNRAFLEDVELPRGIEPVQGQ